MPDRPAAILLPATFDGVNVRRLVTLETCVSLPAETFQPERVRAGRLRAKSCGSLCTHRVL